MANITAAMVKDLRERTGLGMMDCKKALSEAEGDIEKAIDDLRKASGMKAAKKASRVAADGIVITKVASDGNYGVILEVNSETDFVARDESFLSFANDAVEAAFANKDADVPAILASGLEDQREKLVQKIGENINIRRVARLQFADANEGIVESYVHSNNRIAVLISLRGGDESLAKDIAMHIAASKPECVSEDELSADLLEREKAIFIEQAKESGKPDDIIEKMIVGRMKKFVNEVTLYGQSFVKDPDMTVGALVKSKSSEVESFVRYEVGEGIEKKEDNFVEEVMAQAQGS